MVGLSWFSISNEMADLLPGFLVAAKAGLFVISLVFLISGLDDFFIDLYYAIRALYRRFFVMSRFKPLSEGDLLNVVEKPIAVMIPAWQESGVIRRMLENNLQTINYSNYHFFVGTYRNDLDTQREVELVARHSSRVHRIVTPHDGPTNKSDCLNWVYQGIQLFEKENSVEFQIFVLSDSEDVAHPLVLKLFNYLIPRKDMVQLPVIPLEPCWKSLVCGHYLDEFAEFHNKDILVRENMTRAIPSAGVGTGFSRKALQCLAADNRNQVFSIDSLTEDYDLGLKLQKFGLKQIFARQRFTRTVTRKSWWTGQPRQVQITEYVAIREYFPAKMWASIKQKSRWVTGIALQGWEQIGWKGKLVNRYFLFRDRKALLNNPLTALCYLFVAVELMLRFRVWIFPDSYEYPTLVAADSWLWYIIVADTFFLFERLAQRAFWVHRMYGVRQSLLSVPRLFVSNAVNFMATARAIKMFARYLLTGKIIAWDKTDHAYPSEAQLVAHRGALGDLALAPAAPALVPFSPRLVPQGVLVTDGQFQQARLAHLLIEKGIISSRTWNDMVARGMVSQTMIDSFFSEIAA